MKNSKKRSNLMVTIISIIMFLLGVCIFLYPTVSNYLAKEQYKRLITNYESKNKEIKTEVVDEEYEKALKYNKSLSGEEVYDPFIPGSGYAIQGNYNEVLNVNNDGVMGYIEIPKIRLRIPIFHGSSKAVLQKGIGHLEASALPIGGSGNNPILTGHRGLPSAELFTRLDELKKGDLIFITVLKNNLAYRVSDIFEIEPGDISKLGAYKNRDMITLITCTPYGINTHRLVIQADRTEYNQKEKDKIKPKYTFKLSEGTIIRFMGIILGLICLYIALKLIKRKQKGKIVKEAIVTNIKDNKVKKKKRKKRGVNNAKKKTH